MTPKKSLSVQEKTAQEILTKAKTIGDEGLDKLRRFIGLLDDVTIRKLDTKGENWWFIPNFAESDKIILGFRHL